ncbi:SCO2400 family protein [Streptomyces sp. NPDC002640]
MDYCARCRRHLNLQFNCPGCGTPAWELHKYAEADDVRAESAEPAEPDAGAAEDVEVAVEESGVEATGAGDTRRGGDVRSPGGRRAGLRTPREAAPATRAAARRRGRGPGRMIVIAACLLGALGLGIAAVGGQDTAASAAATADPRPSTVAESASVAALEAESPAPGADPASPTASAAASGSASPSTEASGEASGDASAEESASPSSASQEPPARASGPAEPARTSAPPRPTPTATSASPRPTPTPSPTCERVLWWCA